MKYNLQGPNHSVATACAAGTHSVGDAFNFIRSGIVDMMLAGGADASLDPLSIAGFARMKALSQTTTMTSDGKEEMSMSRPFDLHRNGFVIGEGAGVLVLEELTHALQRQAPIIAEVCGYGLSGDAYHLTSPHPEGKGALQSMKIALQDAQISINQIGYINCHATSTPLGDKVELTAIRSLLLQQRIQDQEHAQPDRSRPLYISSCKGSLGHLLGAAGAVETAFTALALKDNELPMTLHLQTIDPSLQELTKDNEKDSELFHLIQHHERVSYPIMTSTLHSKEENDVIKGGGVSNASSLRYALKNSFGFGGTNASLVLGKYKP
jgi:3-oxoacyl-[acyl-carrier-protein] synthase II